jgi:hypothetical protein
VTRVRAVARALLLLAALGISAGHATVALAREGSGPKKLIEWGWDEPDTAFMRAHAAAMDRVGFDGVVFRFALHPNGLPVNFASVGWSGAALDDAVFADTLADLRSCRFRHLTDNFARLNVGGVGWFDDGAFANVVRNVGIGARVLKEGGAKGFMLDVEDYGAHPWYYNAQKDRDQRTLAEYEAFVRLRGRQLMAAVNRYYPDITILLTHGYGVAMNGPVDRPWNTYWLLKSFLDGLFEAASPSTVLVDANEKTYGYRKRSQFVTAYHESRDEMARASSAADAYRRHLGVGFGIWMDANWRQVGWHPVDFAGNYFTPGEFAYAVSAALDVSDRYAWVYSEQPKWWTHGAPPSYRAALRQARRRPVDRDATIADRRSAPAAALDSAYEVIGTLPDRWRFSADASNGGVFLTWFSPSYDASAWRPVPVPSFWDDAGEESVATAWYRLDWDAPPIAVPAGRTLVLWFGAVADAATIWVNGAKAGSHDDADGWDKPFGVAVTGLLRPGQRNAIVLRVTSGDWPGGLWKDVKLAITK